MGLCEGRVCVVTGAGQGIGRAHVEALLEEGAQVVANDLAAPDVDGALGHGGDVSTAAGAESLVAAALETYGRLDVVVNNAGITRDRMLVNLSEDDWDDVIRVHLKSTFLVARAAARHWREQSKAGAAVDARIVNTVSSIGLYGAPGQSNYGAAKGAIASFTIITAMELARYGVTVNAVCPTALTAMTEPVGLGETDDAKEGRLDPRWVSPAVVWLASPLSHYVTGRVVIASGKRLAIAEGWNRGPTAPPVERAADVDAVIRGLLAEAAPNADVNGDVGG